MKRKTKQHRRTTPAPMTIAHIVPNWRIKPGSMAKALCGERIRIPVGESPIADESQCVICALCEASILLDGVPKPPSHEWTQPELW